MKANEIQIGDYFFVEKDNLCIRKGSVVEIRGIDADDRLESKNLIGSAHCRPLDPFQFEGGIWLDYLEPIPLTPEILEENTSESNKNMFGGMNYVLNADYFIENRGDRFCLSRRMAGHKYSTFWVCDIHYVHELQHALRLCGIDKEIVI